MKDARDAAAGDRPDLSPEMRRGVSRRGFLTDELGKAGVKAVRQLPGLGGLLGIAFRESAAQRDERLVENLWLLLMGRRPKPEENSAGMELVRNAATADEKGDALVDILWALCQTKEFDELGRPDGLLIRGLYRIALDREPTEEERNAALEVMAEARETALAACGGAPAGEAEESSDPEAGEEAAARISPEDAAAAARVAALEGLFTGLIRSGESVLRRGVRG